METWFVNGIHWEIEQESDGWYSIYEIVDCKKLPHIQAKDRNHALKYINSVERINFDLNIL